jgi:hypothetical protein
VRFLLPLALAVALTTCASVNAQTTEQKLALQYNIISDLCIADTLQNSEKLRLLDEMRRTVSTQCSCLAKTAIRAFDSGQHKALRAGTIPESLRPAWSRIFTACAGVSFR